MEVPRAGLIIRRMLAYLVDGVLILLLWFVLCRLAGRLQPHALAWRFFRES